jgi:hypothetical protein
MVTGCSSLECYVDLYSFCQSQDVGCCRLVMNLKDSIPFSACLQGKLNIGHYLDRLLFHLDLVDLCTVPNRRWCGRPRLSDYPASSSCETFS